MVRTLLILDGPMTLPWMAAKILLRPVTELRAHSGNARVHGAAQIEQIKASMLAFGFTVPLLVDEAGVLIAGHGRLEAAMALGIEKVPTIVLRHLSTAQKEALRLADAFRARVIDATTESFVFELTGKTDKIDQFLLLMQPLGLVEISRTGVAAIARGPEAM